METKVEALQDNKVKLTVTVDAKEVDRRISKTYKDFAYKYNFPGFRKGKAPRPIIDNALGAEAVLVTVTDEVVNESYPIAVDDSGIFPVAKPEFDEADILVENGKPFTFSATVPVKPQFELSSYDPVEIQLPSEGASDVEVQMQIDGLREHYFDYVDAPAATKIAEDGYADLVIEATDGKGEKIEALSADARLYGLGTGFYPKAFDEQLVGMKKGGKKSFDLDTKDEDAASLAAFTNESDTVHFEVEVAAVKKKELPEATDEWASETLGFESLADLKERITETITQNKAESLPRMKESECLYALAERLEGEVPESMAEAAEADLLQTFFQQLQSQSMSLDAYLAQAGITMDQFREDIKKQAIDVTKQDLALDAWARKLDIEITDADVTDEFAKSGAEDPKALEKQWRENGQLHTLRQSLLRVRALNDLMDTAVVTEPDFDKPEEKPGETKASKKSTEKKKSGKPEDGGKPAKKKATSESDSDKPAAGGDAGKQAEADGKTPDNATSEEQG